MFTAPLPTLAFIGAGNMSRSIIAGLIQAGYPASQMIAANPSQPKLSALAADFAIATTQTNAEAARHSDVLILAVKPQKMAEVLAQLHADLGSFDGKLLISLAAGITTARLSAMAAGYTRLIRTMPNTPVAIGLGMTGLYADPVISAADRALASQIMCSVGQVLWVAQEAHINHVIAAAGSAPAYFFLFMEAMSTEAERLGFSTAEARQLVAQAALGAATLVAQSPDVPLSQLRAQVTSQGGTTAAAIASFTQDDLAACTARAMQAAIGRASEMEQLF
ncbi:MAG: pyrroline-5-carboxylate reductase [Aeromonas sp.]